MIFQLEHRYIITLIFKGQTNKIFRPVKYLKSMRQMQQKIFKHKKKEERKFYYNRQQNSNQHPIEIDNFKLKQQIKKFKHKYAFFINQ